MITQERLKEVLDYNPETGLFTWRVAVARRVKVGDVAGCISRISGYRLMCVDSIMYSAGSLAVLYMKGYMPMETVDHANRVRSDNRWSNLREASPFEQSMNRGNRSDNSSGVQGVSFRKCNGRWAAYIHHRGSFRHLGHYELFVEAVCARYAAEQCLGFDDWDHGSSAKKFVNAVAFSAPL